MRRKFIAFGIIGIAAFVLTGCNGNNVTNPATSNVQTQKAKENEVCNTSKLCEEGLKCLKGKCSSGKVDSTCETYKDCQSGLYCLKSICSNPPSYTKYFTKIQIGKMKQGMPPGPNNIPVPTTEFKSTDAIEIDVIAKSGVSGTFYYELVNSTTGMTEFTTADNKQKVQPGNWGTGFGIPGGLSGNFDLNIYFNDELVSITAITIS